MEKLFASFIIPVYKVEEEYLEKCIESLCGISKRDIEILLVDDGSPDNCGAICDGYAKKDNRIKVFHKENEGVSSTRNFGIDKAKGEYLTFIDADDWIESSEMDMILDSMQDGYDLYLFAQYIDYKNRQLLVRPFNCDKRFSDKEELEALQKMVFVREYGSMRTWLGAGVVCNAVDKFIKRELIETNHFSFDENIRIGEDALFNLCVLNKCKTAKYLDIYAYHYRMRKSSACHTVGEVGYRNVRLFVNEAKRLLDRMEKNDSFIEALYCRCYDLLFEQFDKAYLSYATENNLNSCVKMIKRELKEEPFSVSIKTVKLKDLLPKDRVKAILFKMGMPDLFLALKVAKRRLHIDDKEQNRYY